MVRRDDNRLRRLVEDGKRVVMITELLRRTEDAVYRRASTLGITFKRRRRRALLLGRDEAMEPPGAARRAGR